MPGNKFEKQVQQKMDELKFVPSADVWHQVEKQVNERKKRRLPFLWLLLMGVLLGGATWLYTIKNMGQKPFGNQQPFGHAVAGTENARSEKNNASAPGSNASAKQEDAEISFPVTAGKKQTIEPVNPAETGKRKEPVVAAGNEAPVSAITSATAAGTKAQRSKKESLGVSVAAGRKQRSAAGGSSIETGITKNKPRLLRHRVFTEKSTVSGQAPAATASVPANEEAGTNNTVTSNNTTAQGIAQAAAIEVDTFAAVIASGADSLRHKDTTIISSPPLAQKKAATKKKKNIQWGISAGLGGSNISQNISGLVSDVFSASTAYSVAADRNNLQNTPGNVNNGNLNSFTRPGALKPGLSYSLNLFINKPLGRHFQLMAGLGYSYYSMGLQVGSKIDSNKALLQFSNGNSTTYTNRFHFIELPVTIQKQLGNTSRFSVNGGLAVSLLAGSNALQYSSSKNIYFKDNSNINKLKLGLQAGFNYRVSQKSLWVEAGPQLSYGLSNIFKKETYGNMHLFFAGINARVYFNRNKR